MVDHKIELHPSEKVKIGPIGKRIAFAGFGLGVGAIALAVVIGATRGDELSRFYHAYLLGVTFFLTCALGALFFVIIQHLVKAKWSIVVRRIAEILTMTFPALFALTAIGILLPMLAGSHSLYEWSDPEVMANDHLLHAKSGWLNPVFFSIRISLYFVIWIAMSRYFFGNSVEQDESGDPEISDKLRAASGPLLIVFAFSLAGASFDLLMSLAPRWYSTMWPVYIFAGSVVSIMALLVLVPLALQKAGKLVHSINVEHYHDVGKLLFAFLFFWGYIAFSQFMLYWYADLPEETIWFKYRMFTNWKYLAFFLLVGHFIFPFVCLITRETKRNLKMLAMLSLWMLFMHLVDLYFIIMPQYGVTDVAGTGYRAGFVYDFWAVSLDVLCVVGVAGVFFGAAAHVATRVKLIPVKEPGLSESLGFENY